MANPEEQQLAHAAQIRAFTEGRRQQAAPAHEPLTRGEVAAMIAAAIAQMKVTITGANGINVTGQFPAFTIGQQPVTGTISGTIDCTATPPTLTGTITLT